MRAAVAGVLAAALAPLAPAAAAPGVTVLPRTTGLDPAGADLTVRGSGFDPGANGGVGIYVVFGPKGSDYATNADRYQAAKWVRSRAVGGAGESELRPDGTFEVVLRDLTARYEDGNGDLVDCYEAQCLVMTFTAHGVPDRGNDTFTPVSFATGRPAPVGKAVVPYRPTQSPAATRPAATAVPAPAARAAAPKATARPAATATPSATPVAPSVPPPASSPPQSLAAPVPVAGDSGGPAPLAAAVVVGLGAGAAYAVRRRLAVAR